MIEGLRLGIAVVAIAGCVFETSPSPAPSGSSSVGDATLMFVQIEGTLDELRGLTMLPGLELSRGAHDLGDGRWRAGAEVRSHAALDEVYARGLTVTITMEEDEVERRLRNEHQRP